MNKFTFTNLARPIDLNYKTNKLIVVITVLAFAVNFWLSKEMMLSAEIGLAVFLAWALTREFDPERENIALVNGITGGIYAHYLGIPRLGLLFLLLLISRAIVQTVSDKLTIFDKVGLLAMAGYVVWGLYPISFNLVSMNTLYFALAINILFLGEKMTKNKLSVKMDKLTKNINIKRVKLMQLIFAVLTIMLLNTDLVITGGFLLSLQIGDTLDSL